MFVLIYLDLFTLIIDKIINRKFDNKIMSTIDDSGTFMSRRAYHSKNYKQLPLRRIDIDSSHLPAKGRRSGR